MDEKQFTDMAVKIQEVDSRSRSNEHRIDDLEIGMDKIQDTQITLVKLANGIDKMGEQLVGMKEDIKDVKSGQAQLNDKVTILENRPAQNTQKRLSNIYDKLLWLVVGGLAAGGLAAILPNIPW